MRVLTKGNFLHGRLIRLWTLLFLFSLQCAPLRIHAASTEPAQPGAVWVLPHLPNNGYGEAPELAKRVMKGELPPVDKRLPVNPLIVQPVERLGEYGGVWHMALLGLNDHNLLTRTIGYEHLVRWDPQWNRIVPNLAEAYTESPDAKTYTFRLRKGLKWSDGTPFDANDILFWFEDVASNPDLAERRANWRSHMGRPFVVEKINDWEFRFHFEVPHGLFLQFLAHPAGNEITSYPKHYMSRFHPKYNTTNLTELMRQEGQTNWTSLWEKKHGRAFSEPTHWQNPELPRLGAWIPSSSYDGSGPVVALRNPYYWKIDPAGRQLPYIDTVLFQVAPDEEELLAMATEGRIDFQFRTLGQERHRHRIETAASSAGYRLIASVSDQSNQALIALNLNHLDLYKRQLYQSRDFRTALSLAIDRPAIIQQVFGGHGIPSQTAPKPQSPYFNTRLATQFTQYDPARARQLLETVPGITRSPEGRCLDAEGTPVTVEVLVQPAAVPLLRTLEMVQEDWRKVGVGLVIHPCDSEEKAARIKRGLHDAVITDSKGGLDVVMEPYQFIPLNSTASFAVFWSYWDEDAPVPDGEEPPAEIKVQKRLYKRLHTESSQTVQDRLIGEILNIAANQFYTIGILQSSEEFGIIKNNFRNVPGLMPDAFSYPTPAPSNPCQYFFDAPPLKPVAAIKREQSEALPGLTKP